MASRHPHTILVRPSTQNGLHQPSVLLVAQLRAIDKARIVQTLGTLEQQYLEKLDLELRHLLDLPS